MLLIDELPNLGRMLRAERTSVPPEGTVLTETITRTLELTAGNPGLIRALDAAATDLPHLLAGLAGLREIHTLVTPDPLAMLVRDLTGWARIALAGLSDQATLAGAVTGTVHRP